MAPSKDTSDARNNILECLFDGHELGRPRVPEDEVLASSGYARTDSTGYRKIMKELTKDSKLVVKEKKELFLTEEGIKEMESKAGTRARKPKKTNADFEVYHKERVIKLGKGKVPAAKLDTVWDLLRDRRAHGQDEMLSAAGYQRADSTGFRVIMKCLKDLELIERDGRSSWKFVESKVFPVKN